MKDKQILYRSEVSDLIRNIRIAFFSEGNLIKDSELASMIGVTSAQFCRLSRGVCSASVESLFRLLAIRKRQGYSIDAYITNLLGLWHI